MFKLKLSVINWEAYDKLGLNDYKEFFILDLVRLLQRTEGSKHPGWCYMSRETMGQQLRISKRTVQRFVKPLIEKGYLQTNELGHLKCSTSVYNLLKFGDDKAGEMLNQDSPKPGGGDTLSLGVTGMNLGVTNLFVGVTDLSKGGDYLSPNTYKDNSNNTRERETHAPAKEIEPTRIKNTSVEVSAAAPQIHKPYLPIYEGLKGKLFKPEMDRAADLLSRPQMMLDSAFQKIVSIPGEKQSDILKKFLNEPKHDGLDYFASIRRFSNYVDTWSRNLSQRQTA